MQMFLTIYTHEIKQWFRRPSLYIYILIMVFIATISAGASAGLFTKVKTIGIPIANSPMSIIGLFKSSTTLLLFLLPSIIGLTIHRDYKSKMDALLYSYPFSKAQYLLGKFLSGFTILALIVFAMTLGMMIGFRLPGTNTEAVGTMRLGAYLYTTMVYVLPNMFVYGILIFTIVTFTRNTTTGFIGIIVIMFAQGFLSQLVNKVDNEIISALLSPSGSFAFDHYTNNWTLAEVNTNALPFGKLIIYNRLFWLAIAGAVGFFIYKKFAFSTTPPSFNIFKKKGKRVTKRNFGGITRINLPKFDHDYSLSANIKTTWRLSNMDFKYILKSIPFIILLALGVFMVVMTLFFQQNINGLGYKTPSTSEVLRIGFPGIEFSMSIITFLYAGMLVNRASSNFASFLIDSTPAHNWMFWLSKLIAVLKVQLVLLTTVMIGCIGVQLYKRYYDIEIGHYIFELYVLQFSKLTILAIFALFVQTMFQNAYVGLFIMFFGTGLIPLLPFIGVESLVFQLNMDTSYTYTNNQYEGLKPFLLYRLYWLSFGLVLIVLTDLFWMRGLVIFKERIATFKERATLNKKILLVGFLLLFVGMGAYLYNTDFKNRAPTLKEAMEQAKKASEASKKNKQESDEKSTDKPASKSVDKRNE